MQIKVFKAPTMKEAMEQVKAELGEDAVILHTKKKKEGGILGYGSQEMVEVTAAIEEAPAAARKKPKRKASAPVAQPAAPVLPPSVLTQYKTNGTAEGVAIASQSAEPMPPISAPDFPSFGEPPKRRTGRIIKANPPAQQEAGEFPEIGGLLGNAAVEGETPKSGAKRRKRTAKEPVPEEGSSEDQEKIQKLENELAQMKALLAQFMSKDAPQGIVTLQEALHLQEVEEEILQDMAARSGAGETLSDRASQEAQATLTKYLSQVAKFTDGIQLNRHGVRIAALLGATGVGKTTTLAKIAARFVLDRGVSAALITADTYRISAVEQLKTYSDIIGLPLEIVYTPSELSKAIRKHRGKDLILIDTAGRSQHNEYQMKELQEFLEVNSHIEKHLVLSATTKPRDAADILEKFSVCEPDHVIFTKTDETSSVGIILNLLYAKKISLSYLTNGQSVPDDILPASAERLAELLLRE